MLAILLLGTMLCLAACQNQSGEGNDDAQNYELLTLAPTNHQVEVQYAAQIRGSQDIRIIPRVEGYLQQIKVKEGELVKKGQLLFVIDQVAYRAAVESARAGVLQAEAQYAKAQQELEGKQHLHQSQVVSDFDLRQSQHDLSVAKANLEASRAALHSAQNDLSFTELRSPSDGVVGRLPYRQGDLVSPQTTEGLTIVSNNSKMFVYFSLTESRIMQLLAQHASMQEAIAKMPTIRLQLAGGQVYDHEGRIESISGVVDDKTGAVSVRAVFPNPGGRLLSGGTGRVLMPNTYRQALLVPQEATFEIQDKVFVYKVIDGKASQTMIDVERLNDGQHFVVKQGLKAGDVIIASGAGLVREGASVRTEN